MVWVQITNSLHQTAENTIDRFEYYHSEAPVQYRQGDIYLSERQRKIEEEINLMQSITQLHSEQTTMIHQTPILYLQVQLIFHGIYLPMEIGMKMEKILKKHLIMLMECS